MKIAIISDLHTPHWLARTQWYDLVAHLKDSLHREQPDIVIDAGDCEVDLSELLQFPKGILFSVKGNHDWYHRDFEPRKRFVKDMAGEVEMTYKRETKIALMGDFMVLGCTLWTDYRNGDPEIMRAVDHGLNDSRLIRNFNAHEAYAEHRADVAWLESYSRARNNARPTVVVTHHAPSTRSIHPRYMAEHSQKLNYGFVSDLDYLVEAISPKVWVHGHVHDPMDYMIGDTRVIANPCGYPFERRNRLYEPVYVDL